MFCCTLAVEMADKESSPRIPKNLLDKLDKLYPSRPPELGMDMPEVWYKAGQRSVIDFLTALYEEQNKTIIDDVPFSS